MSVVIWIEKRKYKDIRIRTSKGRGVIWMFAVVSMKQYKRVMTISWAGIKGDVDTMVE